MIMLAVPTLTAIQIYTHPVVGESFAPTVASAATFQQRQNSADLEPTAMNTTRRLRLATAALSGLIYAGYPNKRGDGFREPRHEVTSDALKAVIEHIGDNKTRTVRVEGVPTYEITVRKLTSP